MTDRVMEHVYLRGMGLACALGEDVQHCVTAMRDMRVPSTGLRLDGFGELMEFPYYRVPDAAQLFDSERHAQLLPAVVRAALHQSGLNAGEIRRLPMFIGSSCFSIGQSETLYAAALAKRPETALPMPLCGYQDIGETIRQTLGCAGESWTWNTACTASANALLGALRMIESGWYPHALVVGVELANRTTLTGFSGLQLVAEAVRPFDAERKGMVFGEGIGAAVLSAQPGSGNRIKLIGGANNCDTYSVTLANPDGDSIAALLSTTLARIGLKPEQIRGIKAHATASPGGDMAEAHGMRQVFNRLPPVTALKPFIGHTLGACGVNELVLFAAALQQGFLPAAPGFEIPDPALGVTPLTTPVSAPEGVYLLNHFGFGGNNTVLAVEKVAS